MNIALIMHEYCLPEVFERFSLYVSFSTKLSLFSEWFTQRIHTSINFSFVSRTQICVHPFFCYINSIRCNLITMRQTFRLGQKDNSIRFSLCNHSCQPHRYMYMVWLFECFKVMQSRYVCIPQFESSTALCVCIDTNVVVRHSHIFWW